jgi:hypothetical protein
MVKISVIRLIVILFAIILTTSCATQNKAELCPSIGMNKVKKFKKHRKIVPYQTFKFVSINKRTRSQKKRSNKINKYRIGDENYSKVSRDTNPTLLVSLEVEYSMVPTYKHKSEGTKLNPTIKHRTMERAETKIRETKYNQTNNSKMKNSNTLETTSRLSKTSSAGDSQNMENRKTARTIGGALLLMAVLAGISIPSVGTLAASVGLIGVFLLDIVVSLGIIKYYKKEKPKLAKRSGVLRLLYTAFLGVAIGYSTVGNVSMFNSIWGVGLIVFGVHLISLGILFNNNGGKKWVNLSIKSLLISCRNRIYHSICWNIISTKPYWICSNY